VYIYIYTYNIYNTYTHFNLYDYFSLTRMQYNIHVFFGDYKDVSLQNTLSSVD